MPRVLYPNGKPCKCGCGKPTKRYVLNGVFKGWTKYLPGHQPAPALCDPKIRKKAFKTRQAERDLMLPIGSRRTKKSRNTSYWEIKVAGGGRWRLEHRVIMEKRLGRKLLRSEHVHHRDNNGLNNGNHADGKSNLELLTASVHMRRTNAGRKPTCQCVCPNCGKNIKHFAKQKR